MDDILSGFFTDSAGSVINYQVGPPTGMLNILNQAWNWSTDRPGFCRKNKLTFNHKGETSQNLEENTVYLWNICIRSYDLEKFQIYQVISNILLKKWVFYIVEALVYRAYIYIHVNVSCRLHHSDEGCGRCARRHVPDLDQPCYHEHQQPTSHVPDQHI